MSLYRHHEVRVDVMKFYPVRHLYLLEAARAPKSLKLNRRWPDLTHERQHPVFLDIFLRMRTGTLHSSYVSCG